MNFIPLMLVMATFSWGHGVKPACGQPFVSIGVKQVQGYTAMAYKDTCQIVLHDLHLSNQQLCTVIYHEVGHLFGHDHTKKGLMAGVWYGRIHKPCRKFSEPMITVRL